MKILCWLGFHHYVTGKAVVTGWGLSVWFPECTCKCCGRRK